MALEGRGQRGPWGVLQLEEVGPKGLEAVACPALVGAKHDWAVMAAQGQQQVLQETLNQGLALPGEWIAKRQEACFACWALMRGQPVTRELMAAQATAQMLEQLRCSRLQSASGQAWKQQQVSAEHVAGLPAAACQCHFVANLLLLPYLLSWPCLTVQQSSVWELRA